MVTSIAGEIILIFSIMFVAITFAGLWFVFQPQNFDLLVFSHTNVLYFLC